jgi:hypothetical protein
LGRKRLINAWSAWWEFDEAWDANPNHAGAYDGRDGATNNRDFPLPPQVLTSEAQVSIVRGTPLRALDKRVGGRDQFELLLGRLITGPDVWMVHFGAIAKRRSNRVVIGVRRNTEHVIDGFHGTPVQRSVSHRPMRSS